MQIALYLVAGLTLTWTLYIAYLWLATKAIEGHPTEELSELFPALQDEPKALLYCFSPHCGPCRQMSPIIDELKNAGTPIFKLDVSEHAELSKDLGIRAAPTLMLLSEGVVKQVRLGGQTRAQIQQLMDSA